MTILTPQRPASVTRFWPSLVAYSIALVLILICTRAGLPTIATATIGVISALCGLLWIEVKWPSTDGLLMRAPCTPLPAIKASRIRRKLIGLLATLLPLSVIYMISAPWTADVIGVFLAVWPLIFWGIILLSPIVFIRTDRRMDEPEDSYFLLGCLLIGRTRAGSWPVIRTHILGWVIKGFFLPLMFSWYVKLIAITTAMLAGSAATSFAEILTLIMVALFIVDLLGALIGYSMTFKALGSHIRSVNSSVTGWIAALICYPPFYYLTKTLTSNIEDLAWVDKVAARTDLLPLGVAIIVLQLIYTLATVNFGLRFSNLTHRGIVTGGLYRWVKHPAYLAKNAFWWLMTIPFLDGSAHSAWVALAICSVNTLYFVRAKTEEKHLREDPVYRAYCAWIEVHGLFAPLSRLHRAAVRQLSGKAPLSPTQRPGWQSLP